MIEIIMVAVFCVPLMYLVLWAITFYGSSDAICIVVDSVLAEGMICAQLCKQQDLDFLKLSVKFNNTCGPSACEMKNKRI